MIRIVTESMSDFTQEEAKAADLIVLPLPIRFGMEEYWDDGVSLTQDDFYARLRVAKEPVSYTHLRRRPAHPVRERFRLRAGRTAAAFRCVRAASPPSAGHRASPASIPCLSLIHIY